MSIRVLRVMWTLIVIATVVTYMATFGRYPAEETLFPRLVAYPVLGLAVISLINEGLRAWRAKPSDQRVPRIALGDLTVGILFGLGYLALWLPLGFILDTIVFLFVTPLLLKHNRRQAPVLAGIAVGMALLFSFLFHLGSGAILPRGFLNIGWF